MSLLETSCMSKLVDHYGYSLFSNKAIIEIMDTDFLQVDVNTPIHTVAKLAMKRDANHLYDFITVTENGQLLWNSNGKGIIGENDGN